MDVSLTSSGKSLCLVLQLSVHSVEIKRNSSSPVKTVQPRAGEINLCTILAVGAARAELWDGDKLEGGRPQPHGPHSPCPADP